MSTPADAVKTVQKATTKISKEKITEALRKMTLKEIPFVIDSISGYSVVLLKID